MHNTPQQQGSAGWSSGVEKGGGGFPVLPGLPRVSTSTTSPKAPATKTQSSAAWGQLGWAVDEVKEGRGSGRYSGRTRGKGEIKSRNGSLVGLRLALSSSWVHSQTASLDPHSSPEDAICNLSPGIAREPNTPFLRNIP